MLTIAENEIIKNWNSHDIPLVSIKCLTYNHEKYISQALDGFLMQKTNFPFEIVVHDDASTDKTAEIIREYEKKYPQIIKPIYQIENQYSKPGVSVNSFIYPKLMGKYIATCEGDDYWIDENKLQMQVDFLERNPEYEMCYTNFNIFYQNKNKFDYDLFTTQPNKFIKDYDSLEQWILKKGYIAPMTWVYKRSLLDSYDSMNSCDGTFVMVAHFMANSKIKCLDKTTATYRVLTESASHTKDLNKLYNRHKNLRDVQNSLIDKYVLNESLKNQIDENYCKQGLKVLIAVGTKDDIDLCRKYFSSKKYKYILFIFNNPILRNLFKFAYSTLRNIKK